MEQNRGQHNDGEDNIEESGEELVELQQESLEEKLEDEAFLKLAMERMKDKEAFVKYNIIVDPAEDNTCDSCQ